MLARCPHCRSTFDTDRFGRQDCPACKRPLYVPDPQTIPEAVTHPPEIPAGARPAGAHADGAPGTPWEQRAELGFARGFGLTLKQALFDPGRLFRSARLDRGWDQLGFATLLYVLASWVGALLAYPLALATRAQRQQQIAAAMAKLNELGDAGKPMAELMRKLIAFSEPKPSQLLLSLLLAPLFGLLFVVANALVTHLFALLFRQSRQGFGATFAACAYGIAPCVLMVVSFVPMASLAMLIWIIALTSVGMMTTHKIEAGGAAATTLTPTLLLFCCSCALFAVLAARTMHP